MIRANPLELIGNTPLIELRRINPNSKVTVAIKMEAMSIGGSIKDRVALAMIEAAEASGELTPDKVVIEATSGNTGVGLAMVCAVKGYTLQLLMPESASEERKRIMRAYGAELILTPAHMSTDGAIEEAYRMAREEPETYVLMDQFNNPASIAAHYEGTGREIWEQTKGRVTHVVATLGTSGTVMGICKRIHEISDTARVVAVEPNPGHKIQGLKNMQESYPPGIYDKRLPDEIVRVEDEESFETARLLAREEGLLLGMSSGAAVAAALKLAANLDEGLVVVVCPDGGERYLSTPLFAPPARQGLTVMDVATGAQKVVSPLAEEVTLFVPGPSLDAPADPEPWRRIVLADVLARSFAARGEQARIVVGLADLDDRALESARTAGRRLSDHVGIVTEELTRLAADLGVTRSISFAPASRAADRAIDLTRGLMRRGFAYEKLRSVYFDVLRDKRYGEMLRLDPDSLDLGRTVDLADYVKDNPRDFTLLKRASLADLKAGDVWETDWGKVRPSWFLQMASTALEAAARIDVVLAAEAQRFPHLENFRAIWSEGAKMAPQAWLAVQPVDAHGMERPGLDETIESLGEPLAVRMWLLSAAYRRPLDLTDETLRMWRKNWRKIQDLYAALSGLATDRAGEGGEVRRETQLAVADLKGSLKASVEHDLALHHFWAGLFGFAKSMNSLMAKSMLTGSGAALALGELSAVNDYLGLVDTSAMPLAPSELPSDAARLVDAREAARAARDFAKADALRDELLGKGYRLEDGPSGVRVFRV
jgi:cysteinyl-tRNA synthetase